RSGRMTATMDFLDMAVGTRPAPPDWIYLSDFRASHSPAPYSLPAGVGRLLQRRIDALVPQLQDAIRRAFGSEGDAAQGRGAGGRLRDEVQQRVEALREEAQKHGLDVVDTPQGATVAALQQDPAQNGEHIETKEQRAALVEAGKQFADALADIKRWAI